MDAVVAAAVGNGKRPRVLLLTVGWMAVNGTGKDDDNDGCEEKDEDMREDEDAVISEAASEGDPALTTGGITAAGGDDRPENESCVTRRDSQRARSRSGADTDGGAAGCAGSNDKRRGGEHSGSSSGAAVPAHAGNGVTSNAVCNVSAKVNPGGDARRAAVGVNGVAGFCGRSHLRRVGDAKGNIGFASGGHWSHMKHF